MSPDPGTPDPSRTGRARLRRSGRHLLRLGALLAVVSLVVTLVAGWATRSLLDHLQTNSAELLDGTATITLSEGEERTLYVTGGLVAPGETVPTPVDQISCTITGPGGELPFADLASQDRRVGIDTALARFQVVGDFAAEQSGEHRIDCEGLGVVVAPEVSPVSALARLGGLALGTIGSFAGLSMVLIGAILVFFVRRAGEEDDEVLDDAVPPEEGADEWWEEESAAGSEGSDDEYVELSQEELEAMSPEQIEELVRSGALVFDDDESGTDGTGTDSHTDTDDRRARPPGDRGDAG